jgi:hypothetical protein
MRFTFARAPRLRGLWWRPPTRRRLPYRLELRSLFGIRDGDNRSAASGDGTSGDGNDSFTASNLWRAIGRSAGRRSGPGFDLHHGGSSSLINSCVSRDNRGLCLGGMGNTSRNSSSCFAIDLADGGSSDDAEPKRVHDYPARRTGTPPPVISEKSYSGAPGMRLSAPARHVPTVLAFPG